MTVARGGPARALARALPPSLRALVHRGRSIGVAIGHDCLTAVEPRVATHLRGQRPGRGWTIPIEPADASGLGGALGAALEHLRVAIGEGDATLHVALLHPLAHAKTVAIPLVGSADLPALLTRSARRYFVVGAEPVVADAQYVRGTAPAGRVRALACFADERTVSAVTVAVRAAGFGIGAMTAAPVAFAEAVRVLAPAVRRGRVTVAAQWSTKPELLQFERGSPVAISSADLDTSHADGEPESVLIGAEALGERSPAAIAAFGAAILADDAPSLLPEDLRRARDGARRTAVRALGIAAAAVLAVSVALHAVGLRREIAAVEARRAEIASAVARAMAVRRVGDIARERAEAIRGLETHAPRWTATLAALSEALPDSAYLGSFAASGTNLRFRVVTPSSESVVPALRASPLLGSVALLAPGEREESTGLEAVELTAALRGPLAAAYVRRGTAAP